MKLPKIKLTRTKKLRIAQVGCVIMYSLGAALYGALNYMEGQENEWRYIADNADNAKSGSIIFHEGDMESKDNMYWVAGREKSKEILEGIVKRHEEVKDNE